MWSPSAHSPVLVLGIVLLFLAFFLHSWSLFLAMSGSSLSVSALSVSSQSTVIALLQQLIRTPIHDFVLVQYKGTKHYIALSRSMLLLIDESFKVKQTISFELVQFLELSLKDSGLVSIGLGELTPIRFWTNNRKVVVDKLSQFISAERMLRRHTVFTLPIIYSPVVETTSAKVQLYTDPE